MQLGVATNGIIVKRKLMSSKLNAICSFSKSIYFHEISISFGLITRIQEKLKKSCEFFGPIRSLYV